MSGASALDNWLESVLGHRARDPALFRSALTHASHGDANYERLEFLGDRVLGLAIAAWLFEIHGAEAEGKLAHRLNRLVSRETCALVGRAIGLVPFMRLGKQARDDGAADSDNVVGDIVEALIGALYVDAGHDAAIAFVRSAWREMVEEGGDAPKHPKSALQEWAAAHHRKPPAYRLVRRSGPSHAPFFLVEVSIAGAGAAEAEGRTRQDAETLAAAELLAQLAT